MFRDHDALASARTRPLRRLFLTLFAAGVLYLGTLAGATRAAAEPNNARASSFRAVEGAQRESVSGIALTAGAYGIVLVLLFAYGARLVTEQRALAEQVAEAHRLLEMRRGERESA